MILELLVQFVLRLSFGLALAMLVTSSKLVTSGFFRVHLWVVMGLATLAALAATFNPDAPPWIANPVLWACVAAAILSYLGAVIWLYEQAAIGKLLLALVMAATLAGALFDHLPADYETFSAPALACADVISGGLVLGLTMAAMLLGHWYLNTPTMKLEPLQRLVVLMGAAVVLRAVICGTGLSLETSLQTLEYSTWLFVALRWLSGIVATLGLVLMTWQTLKIPNTQSATGILYVGVICTFLGELTSQLLSVSTTYPL